MSLKYATLPVDHIRRQDRAVSDDEWIVEFLERAPIGVLAMQSDGQPLVNSNLFAYDRAAHAIYMHTARSGRTRAAVDEAPRVCFTVNEMGRLLPADEALEFSVEYAGVVVFGRAVIVEDAAETGRALQKLMDKYFPHLHPGIDYRPIVAEELARTSVYRIGVDSWTGKRKVVADDFPGAIRYEDVLAIRKNLQDESAQPALT
jgi:hypothetical protein